MSGVRRLVTLVPAGAVIFPGHGPASTLGELQVFATLLEDVTARVRRRIDVGRTREQVIAEGLPRCYASWARRGIPAEVFLGNAYDGLHAGQGQE